MSNDTAVIVGASVGGGISVLLLLSLVVYTARKHVLRQQKTPRPGTIHDFIPASRDSRAPLLSHSREPSRETIETTQLSGKLLHTSFRSRPGLEHTESTSTLGPGNGGGWKPTAENFRDQPDESNNHRLSLTLPRAQTPSYVTRNTSAVSEHGHILPGIIDTVAPTIPPPPSARPSPPQAQWSRAVFNSSLSRSSTSLHASPFDHHRLSGSMSPPPPPPAPLSIKKQQKSHHKPTLSQLSMPAEESKPQGETLPSSASLVNPHDFSLENPHDFRLQVTSPGPPALMNPHP